MDNIRNNRGTRGSRRSEKDTYDRGRASGREYDRYDEYDDAYWEDEEDYEEFARSMDREYELREKRPSSARAAEGRRTAGSRGVNRRSASDRPRDYMEAGDMDRSVGADRRGNDVPSRGKDRRGAGASGSRKGSSSSKKSKPRKKRGILGILLRLIVILLLIAVIAVGLIYYRMKDTLDVLEMQRVNSVDLEKQLMKDMNHRAKNDNMMDGYMNIALFGVDSRSGDLLDGDNRSDTIMICSINESTGEIRLVSVYRDTVLDVGGENYTKANSAYALGGPAQAITMLNQNLDLNILDFVTVGFEGLAHTIDALGGIEIEIDEEERGYLNQYVHDMHLELGTDETPVEESGLVTLTGIQATAYSRIRYTAGDDFRRAERQRTVLMKTLEKAKSASPTTLVKVAENVVGDMATSLSSREIVSLILMAAKLELVDTGGIPQEDLRDFADIEAGSAVMPVTLEKNSEWLHQFLFDDDIYEASDEVRQRSEWIANNVTPASYWQ